MMGSLAGPYPLLVEAITVMVYLVFWSKPFISKYRVGALTSLLSFISLLVADE